MGELMAHRSDTANLTSSVKLRAACISIYNDTIEHLRRCYRRARQCPFVWPYCRLLVVSVGLAIACIQYIHLVDIAVAIPVIVGKVHLGIRSLTALHDHHLWPKVVAPTVIGTIVGHVVGKFHRPYDIEVKLEGATALRKEIVLHRTIEISFRE